MSDNAPLTLCNAKNEAAWDAETALALAWSDALLAAAQSFREANDLPDSWVPSTGIPGVVHLILPQRQ